ncbi:serine/threonine-protein kinase [Hyalangium versicolor]|uniref:serine/threonine-protein kinase n=1 Tax=Hyalangium versicolor TaxID=2861190 RepID=UPI001CCC37D8|nr:serine/threonine-protein kinase [Hyalangium versicolor]
MKESAHSAALRSDAEASTLHRSPGTATPLSDELATTLHPSQRSLPRGGVDPLSWNLPLVDRERYLLDGVVAEGGHGRILRAQDLHLERMVALKEPISDGTSTQGRFLREARITARLQHPSIVPVYEAGRWPGGEPFYAMKLVSGRSLARLIESMKTLDERLAALPHVLAVAEAMAYAHCERVIHRDLKPSNVLVGEYGETVVIDWGLAKELDAPEIPADEAPSHAGSPEPERTQLGTVMGTPAYMPPEQAAGQPVDERADVYSLGAILYHLLAGRAPYMGTTSQEVLQHVLTEEPTPLVRLHDCLPQELLDIVSRAMERDPARRYPTARELAEDLRRFQAGQYVKAHRYTLWEKLVRLVRQHRSTFIVAAVLLAALLALATSAHRHIIRERDAAQQERAEAITRSDSLVLLQARHAFEESPDKVLSYLDMLSTSFQDWDRARILAADAMAQGLPMRLQGHTGSINRVEMSPDGQWLVSASDDEKIRLWDLRKNESRVIANFSDEAWRAAFSKDGRYVASSGKEGLVQLWDKTTDTTRELKGHTEPVPFTVFTPDTRYLLTAGNDGKLFRWDVATGTSLLLGSHTGGVADLRLLPNGKHVVTAGTKDRSVQLWDLETGANQLLLAHSRFLTVMASASRAESFAVATDNGQILLWESQRGPMRTLELGSKSVSALALSPDGRYLAAQASGDPILLWDLKDGGPPRSLPSAANWKCSLTFSEDGKWLAAGGKDARARAWEVATGRVRVLYGATATVSTVAFSPDGKWLAAGSHDGTIRVHELAERYPLTVTSHEQPLAPDAVSLDWHHLSPWELRSLMRSVISAVAFTPDGRHVLSAGKRDGTVRLSGPDGASAQVVKAHPGEMTAAFVLEDGSLMATAGQDGTVALWNEQAQRLRELKGPTGRIDVLALSADRTWVAAGLAEGELWLWDAASGQGRSLGKQAQSIRALAFSPDGHRLASGSADGELRLWDVATGQGQHVHSHQLEVVDVTFSRDGTLLASGSSDHTAWIQPLNSEPGRTELAPGQKKNLSGTGVIAMSFSADGREFLSSSMGDSLVMRFDMRKDERHPSLIAHTSSVLHMAVSPDGLRLLTASADGTARLWDLSSGESRALPGHEGPVLWVAFSSDGRQMLSAGQDGTVQVWPDDLPLEPQALREWVHAQATR